MFGTKKWGCRYLMAKDRLKFNIGLRQGGSGINDFGVSIYGAFLRLTTSLSTKSLKRVKLNSIKSTQARLEQYKAAYQPITSRTPEQQQDIRNLYKRRLLRKLWFRKSQILELFRFDRWTSIKNNVVVVIFFEGTDFPCDVLGCKRSIHNCTLWVQNGRLYAVKNRCITGLKLKMMPLQKL